MAVPGPRILNLRNEACLLELRDQPPEKAVNLFVEEVSPLEELLLLIFCFICLIGTVVVRIHW